MSVPLGTLYCADKRTHPGKPSGSENVKDTRNSTPGNCSCSSGLGNSITAATLCSRR